ncbi:6-phosphogluconolactonase [Citricoccus sp. GCM10030269]|uniref:6-phosphogluconolactonase n=1 Tax=Citricoccus sp. GCM10030269 TaxID=3273388 RepID=UPI00361170FF
MSADQEHLFPDQAALCTAAARELLTVLAEAVRDRGVASAVLTGGGTGTGILSAMATLAAEQLSTEQRSGPDDEVPLPDWSRVHVWWGDERFLAAGHPDRNEVQADAALLTTLINDHGLPEVNVHRMPVAETGLMTEAADTYAAELICHTHVDPGPDPRLPVFDVVLLGLGPDGHVASLFPHHPGPEETGATVIAVADSPKPPPLRLSMTAEALSTARRLWFVVAGADKQEAVSATRALRADQGIDPVRWPGSVVSGQLSTTWWLDQAAAGEG